MLSTTNTITNSVCSSLAVYNYTADFLITNFNQVKVYHVDIAGTETLLTYITDYLINTVTSSGFTVTLVNSRDSGILSIRRIVPKTQDSTFVTGDDFPAQVFEDSLDKLTMMFQELKELYDRVITVSLADDAATLDLPLASVRANRYLAFDADGNLKASVGTIPAGEEITASDIPIIDVAGKYTAGDVEAAFVEVKLIADGALVDSSTAQDAADAAASAASDAQIDATAAQTELDFIASDLAVTPVEKLQLWPKWVAIMAEADPVSGTIPIQATAFGVSDVDFDAAYAALYDYIITLRDVFGNMTAITEGIDRSVWDEVWGDYYNERTDLLNDISTAAKARADAAWTVGDNAQTAADNAVGVANLAYATAANNETELLNIADDDILSPGEKPNVVSIVLKINAEDDGIIAEATRYGVSSTDYSDAVTALNSHLAGLTTPVAWNNYTGNTTIVSATFYGKFELVYSERQIVLNAIAAKAKVLTGNAYHQALAPNLVFLNDTWEDTDTTQGHKAHGQDISTSKGGADSSVTTFDKTYGGADSSVTTFDNTYGNIPAYVGWVKNGLYAGTTLIDGGQIKTNTLKSHNYVEGVSGSKFDLASGYIETGSGVFRGNLEAAGGSFSGDVEIGSDDANRQLSLGSKGLLVKDSNGVVIHDLPNAVIASGHSYLGHLLFSDGTTSGYTVYNSTSAPEKAWATITCSNMGTTNAKGGIFKVFKSGIGSATVNPYSYVFLRPNGSSWSNTAGGLSPEMRWFMNFNSGNANQMSFATIMLCPFDTNYKMQFYTSTVPNSTSRQLTIVQLGIYV